MSEKNIETDLLNKMSDEDNIKILINGILLNCNAIRSKLIELGLLDSPTANLAQCKEAIEKISSVTVNTSGN